MKIFLKKIGTHFIPLDDADRELASKLKNGQSYGCDIKKTRNIKFHRKFLALLRLGYDVWSPVDLVYKGQEVEKSFDTFRNNVIILAGYSRPVINLRGEVRMEAKSISFARMDDEEFARLYSNTINVLIKHAFKSTYTKEQVDNIVNQYLEYDR